MRQSGLWPLAPAVLLGGPSHKQSPFKVFLNHVPFIWPAFCQNPDAPARGFARIISAIGSIEIVADPGGAGTASRPAGVAPSAALRRGNRRPVRNP